jgi:hypothetical protein
MMADFMNSMGQFLTAVGPLVKDKVLPFGAAKSIMLSVSRRLRFGAEVEDELEQMQAPEEEGGNPEEMQKQQEEMMKMQEEMQKRQEELSSREEQLKQVELSIQQQMGKIKEMVQKQQLDSKQEQFSLQMLKMDLDHARAMFAKEQQIAQQTKESDDAPV